MVANFPGPYEVEIVYSVDGLVHAKRINTNVVGVVNPGDDPSTITLQTKDSLGIGLNTAVVAYCNALAPLMSTGTNFESYTFWSYTPLTFERTFITTNLLNIVGTSAGVTQAAHQMTETYRTAEGGIMKSITLESTTSSLVRRTFATLSPAHQSFVNLHTAANTWILARDTSYAVAFIASYGGQNEKTFRQRYRS